MIQSVMSHKIAKSHSQFGSDSSGKGFPLLWMKKAMSQKNRWKTALLLSHLTYVWYDTSPCFEPTSCKNTWNWRWFRPRSRMKFTVFVTVVIIYSISRTLPHRVSWWILQWYVIRGVRKLFFSFCPSLVQPSLFFLHTLKMHHRYKSPSFCISFSLFGHFVVIICRCLILNTA